MDLLEREVTPLFTRLGSLQNISEPINARHSFRVTPLSPSLPRTTTPSIRYYHSITYTVEHSNGSYDLHLFATDMEADSPIMAFNLGKAPAKSVLFVRGWNQNLAVDHSRWRSRLPSTPSGSRNAIGPKSDSDFRI